jgi:hypothetical protein
MYFSPPATPPIATGLETEKKKKREMRRRWKGSDNGWKEGGRYFDGFVMGGKVLLGDDDLSIHFGHLVEVAGQRHQSLDVLR